MDRYRMAIRVLTWAKEHPQEWNIVCGLQDADLEKNLTIAEMLQNEKFYELGLMLTLRTLTMRFGAEE